MTLITTDNPTLLAARDLTAGWTVTAAAGPVPGAIAGAVVTASVPGTVHTDLLSAGLIADPYLDENEAALSWIGLVDWTYETTFDLTHAEIAAAERHDLVFDGLDTVATVTLNGVVLGDVADQHRVHRFDVAPLLHAGANRLIVAFRSPVRYANAQSLVLGARERPYALPYEAIRKSACSFGWDWGIAAYTSGIWKPVRLESWSGARLARVLVHAEPAHGGGVLTARALVERASAGEVEIEVDVAGVTARTTLAADDEEAVVRVDVDDVELWWPIGYGAQPLYDVAVRLSAAEQAVDSTVRRVGFRTARWDTEKDAAGRPFQLLVNEVPVWVKGVNWIPDDALFTRVDRVRYERRLRQAARANINLVRVWGGGIYESDDFYDLCDELGLLTWQDFLFACAAYPEEEPLRSEIEAEARDNVTRLAHHASLVLFTGNNENLWGYEDWGWKERLDGKTWGAHYYYDLLPGIVAQLSPHVTYAPGSPFSPGDEGVHPNAETHGTNHLWEQWNRKDWATYREHTPRFVAEFGWQGPPNWSTLERALHDDPLTPESPGMIAHQKAIDGNVKLTGGLVRHHRVPSDMATWHWAMQLNQANAVGFALDHFRSHAPHTSGAIVWQLNDCWPVTSWAAIDGDGREKPLYFALRNAFASRVVTIQPRDDGDAVIVGNDTDDPWTGELVVTRRRYDGGILDVFRTDVAIPARSSLTIAIPAEIATPSDPADELLVAELSGVRGFSFFSEARDSALAAPRLSVAVARDGHEHVVTVTSEGLTRDLVLNVDRLDPDATVDEGLVTLLPGESTTFRVRGLDSLDADQAAHPLVLRSANQLVAS
ncbi:glycoside hydrolase family 2 protein [Microbacterium sp. 4R-513]|uniref:glycoside hydrolase family 2 protein n=1 Tax=Microbacterium sp. 4R-513 TaxID=2567934 RepID=UPI0013E1460D|nr:glycoside hydrolase family 2 protein [Microbacterium sp. 4R-513]QIG39368.1 glycoside hydrolase family 2 protein [Microbacterium sp. 4R-513]